MLAAVVVLAVAVVALLAVLASVAGRRRVAEARVAELEADVAQREGERDAERTRADAAEADAASVRADLASMTARATAAEQQLRQTTDRAERAERAGTELEQRVAEKEQALAAATDREAELSTELAARHDAIARLEADLASAARFDADGWWALESRRADRLWHDRVALPFDPSPMVPEGTDRDAHLRAAVAVFTEVSREESGVVIDLVWSVGRELPPDLCVAVLRLAEELVSEARASDGGELAVTADGEQLTVRLATEPPVAAPADLAGALGRFGWTVEDDGTAVTITLPLPPA